MNRTTAEIFATIAREHNSAWIEWQERPDTPENHSYVYTLVALARDGASDLLRTLGHLSDLTFYQFRDQLHDLSHALIVDLSQQPGYLDAATLTWPRSRKLLETYAAHRNNRPGFTQGEAHG